MHASPVVLHPADPPDRAVDGWVGPDPEHLHLITLLGGPEATAASTELHAAGMPLSRADGAPRQGSEGGGTAEAGRSVRSLSAFCPCGSGSSTTEGGGIVLRTSGTTSEGRQPAKDDIGKNDPAHGTESQGRNRRHEEYGPMDEDRGIRKRCPTAAGNHPGTKSCRPLDGIISSYGRIRWEEGRGLRRTESEGSETESQGRKISGVGCPAHNGFPQGIEPGRRPGSSQRLGSLRIWTLAADLSPDWFLSGLVRGKVTCAAAIRCVSWNAVQAGRAAGGALTIHAEWVSLTRGGAGTRGVIKRSRAHARQRVDGGVRAYVCGRARAPSVLVEGEDSGIRFLQVDSLSAALCIEDPAFCARLCYMIPLWFVEHLVSPFVCSGGAAAAPAAAAAARQSRVHPRSAFHCAGPAFGRVRVQLRPRSF
eukprot:gene8002-biopygen2867